MINKKRLFAFVLALVLTAVLVPSVFAVVSKSDEYYVADYAGVLKQTTKDNIIWSNADSDGLENLCDGAQIVVVTVDYLDGMYSDEYAATLFNEWGVGSASKNNGMLLLLAVAENKGWLEVGYGIRGYWNEKRINDLLDTYFWDEFDRGNFDAAVNNVLEPLFSWYADSYGLFMDDSAVQEIEPEVTVQPRRVDVGWVFFCIVAFFGVSVILLIIVGAAIAGDKMHYNTYYRSIGAVPPRRYHFWYAFTPFRPHRSWWRQNRHHYHAQQGVTNVNKRHNTSAQQQRNNTVNRGSGFGGFGSNHNSGGSSNRSNPPGGGGFGGFGGSSGGGGGRSGGGGGFGGGGGGGGRSGGGGGRR